MRTIAALPILTLLTLASCADKILSDDTISNRTALLLNEPPGSVRVADRRYDGATTTYYTANTPHGDYRCTIDGGTISSLGMTNPPVCARR